MRTRSALSNWRRTRSMLFPMQFLQAHTQGMARKLGLQALGEQDTALVEDLWQLMAEHELDFTLMLSPAGGSCALTATEANTALQGSLNSRMPCNRGWHAGARARRRIPCRAQSDRP